MVISLLLSCRDICRHWISNWKQIMGKSVAFLTLYLLHLQSVVCQRMNYLYKNLNCYYIVVDTWCLLLLIVLCSIKRSCLCLFISEACLGLYPWWGWGRRWGWSLWYGVTVIQFLSASAQAFQWLSSWDGGSDSKMQETNLPLVSSVVCSSCKAASAC